MSAPTHIFQPMGLKVSSMMSLILVSMYGCPAAQVYAARMRILCSYGNSPRVRDITEVMVSVSESAELHDTFIQQYEAPTRDGRKSRAYEPGSQGTVPFHQNAFNEVFLFFSLEP